MKTELTDRDSMLLCKALAYAIETIETLPGRWQEWSDKEDMIALLELLTTDPDYFRIGALSHIQRRGVTVINERLALAERKPGQVIEGVFPRR